MAATQSLPANLRQYKFLKSSDRLVKNLQAHAESSLYLSETYGRGPSADEDLAIVRDAVAEVMDWLTHIARPASADVLDKLERFRAKSIDAVKVCRAGAPSGAEFSAGLRVSI